MAEQPTYAPIDPTSVPGWGVDPDPENDPAWPMRDRDAEPARAMDWARPPQQPKSVEVLMSVEHKRLPAVFGTTAPPSGLSGYVRRGAFVFSESRWTHWLLLLLADRINVAEGVLDDLRRGRLTNIPGELGLGAELKYDRAALQRRAVGTAAVAGVAVLGVLLVRRWRRAGGR